MTNAMATDDRPAYTCPSCCVGTEDGPARGEHTDEKTYIPATGTGRPVEVTVEQGAAFPGPRRRPELVLRSHGAAVSPDCAPHMTLLAHPVKAGREHAVVHALRAATVAGRHAASSPGEPSTAG